MIRIPFPQFLTRWLFPGFIEGLTDRAETHGTAKATRRWWGGIIELEATADFSDETI